MLDMAKTSNQMSNIFQSINRPTMIMVLLLVIIGIQLMVTASCASVVDRGCDELSSLVDDHSSNHDYDEHQVLKNQHPGHDKGHHHHRRQQQQQQKGKQGGKPFRGSLDRQQTARQPHDTWSSMGSIGGHISLGGCRRQVASRGWSPSKGQMIKPGGNSSTSFIGLDVQERMPGVQKLGETRNLSTPKDKMLPNVSRLLGVRSTELQTLAGSDNKSNISVADENPVESHPTVVVDVRSSINNNNHNSSGHPNPMGTQVDSGAYKSTVSSTPASNQSVSTWQEEPLRQAEIIGTPTAPTSFASRSHQSKPGRLNNHLMSSHTEKNNTYNGTNGSPNINNNKQEQRPLCIGSRFEGDFSWVCSGRRIKRIPADLEPKPCILSIEHAPNLITVGPSTFADLSRLRVIPTILADNLCCTSTSTNRLTPLTPTRRIQQTALDHWPDLSLMRQGRILTSVDLDNNKISSLGSRPINIRTELLNLEFNQIRSIDENVFNGSEIATLSLNGNRQLSTIHPNSFAGLKSLTKLYPKAHDPSAYEEHIRHQEEINAMCDAKRHRDQKPVSIPSTTPQGDPWGGGFMAPTNQIEAGEGFPEDFPNKSSPPESKPSQQWSELAPKQNIDFSDPSVEIGSILKEPVGIAILCGVLATSHQSVTCTPEPDAFNPCEDIMGYPVLRFAVWLVVGASILGNLSVIVVLMGVFRRLSVPKFLQLNLAIGDLFMGVYLAMLALADLTTKGTYFNYAIEWQHEYGCNIAGAASLFASQLSIFTLSVITFERYYTITYSIDLNMRLQLCWASRIMLIGWLYAFLSAILPVFADINSYSKTSICLPLRTTYLVDKIYILVLLSIDSIAFVIIFACYLKMYLLIVRQKTEATAKERTVAMRMALLVSTDFACWAPIIFFGTTALIGHPLISVTNSKILIVFFYPLNSMANPFLYVISTRQYRRDLNYLTMRWHTWRKNLFKRHDDNYSYSNNANPYGQVGNYPGHQLNIQLGAVAAVTRVQVRRNNVGPIVHKTHHGGHHHQCQAGLKTTDQGRVICSKAHNGRYIIRHQILTDQQIGFEDRCHRSSNRRPRLPTNKCQTMGNSGHQHQKPCQKLTSSNCYKQLNHNHGHHNNRHRHNHSPNTKTCSASIVSDGNGNLSAPTKGDDHHLKTSERLTPMKGEAEKSHIIRKPSALRLTDNENLDSADTFDMSLPVRSSSTAASEGSSSFEIKFRANQGQEKEHRHHRCRKGCSLSNKFNQCCRGCCSTCQLKETRKQRDITNVRYGKVMGVGRFGFRGLLESRKSNTNINEKMKKITTSIDQPPTTQTTLLVSSRPDSTKQQTNQAPTDNSITNFRSLPKFYKPSRSLETLGDVPNAEKNFGNCVISWASESVIQFEPDSLGYKCRPRNIQHRNNNQHQTIDDRHHHYKHHHHRHHRHHKHGRHHHRHKDTSSRDTHKSGQGGDNRHCTNSRSHKHRRFTKQQRYNDCHHRDVSGRTRMREGGNDMNFIRSFHGQSDLVQIHDDVTRGSSAVPSCSDSSNLLVNGKLESETQPEKVQIENHETNRLTCDLMKCRNHGGKRVASQECIYKHRECETRSTNHKYCCHKVNVVRYEKYKNVCGGHHDLECAKSHEFRRQNDKSWLNQLPSTESKADFHPDQLKQAQMENLINGSEEKTVSMDGQVEKGFNHQSQTSSGSRTSDSGATNKDLASILKKNNTAEESCTGAQTIGSQTPMMSRCIRSITVLKARLGPGKQNPIVRQETVSSQSGIVSSSEYEKKTGHEKRVSIVTYSG